MTITMSSILPDHCKTASARYKAIKQIQTKHECLKLKLNLICHSNRKSPSGMRLSAHQRADQRRVIKLLEKHAKGLPELDKSLVLKDTSIKSDGTKFDGYLSTPQRANASMPDPGFHVKISCHPFDRVAYIDITLSKDNGLYHELIANEIVYANGCEPLDGEYSEIVQTRSCDPFDSAFDRARDIMKTYGLDLILA